MPCTPSGCRVDNGRAIASLDYNATSRTMAVTFRDGSLYALTPIDEAEAIIWTALVDPGCYWNTELATRPGLDVTRERGPS